MQRQAPCYYVLEIPTLGVIPGEKPTAYVRGCHASARIAEGQAQALQTERHVPCCYRYESVPRTVAERRYNLEA